MPSDVKKVTKATSSFFKSFGRWYLPELRPNDPRFIRNINKGYDINFKKDKLAVSKIVFIWSKNLKPFSGYIQLKLKSLVILILGSGIPKLKNRVTDYDVIKPS